MMKIIGRKSEVFPSPSGGPQDCHLSPLLFTLFNKGVKETLPDRNILAF